MIQKRIWIGGFLLVVWLMPRAASASEALLADAAERGDAAVVTQVISGGEAEIDAAQADGMTALHWAVYREDAPMVAMLLQAGADPAVANRYGVAPLSTACVTGNAKIVESLLAAGADPQTTLPGGETVLMTASRTGRLGPVRALLRHQVDMEARERSGQTALMWAAAEGHLAVVDALLDAGAEFHEPLDSGFTPLFFAVRAGHIDVAMRLLQSGADIGATMQPRRSIAKGPDAGMDALSMAVENGHFELAMKLVEAGADPNDQRSGFAPLHRLTWVRKPNSGDGEDGDPPPMGSGNLTSLQFVRAIVASGADVNARLAKGRSGQGQLNHAGATPFLLAAKTDDLPLLRLLVELGADPMLPNTVGSTPLMAAAGLGTLAPTEEAGTEPEAVESVEFILGLGADVNAVDANGETAMHGAAYKSLPAVVQLLADNGADVEIWNHENRYGWTPMRIAEGYRPGNFKPSAETIAALRRVMEAAGAALPPIAP